VKRCIAIRHVAFEDLGSFAPLLAASGFAIRTMDAGYDDFSAADMDGADLLVVLGGPIGAYDDGDYPFLTEELRLIEARLRAGRPIVGICLGAQLMARALGARVYPNANGKEIGWSPLSLGPAAPASPLSVLEGVPVLHWHGDTFDLPEGASLLASTALTRQQAFSWGPAALGLQFHVEATARGLERWFIGHAGEIAATAGVSVPALRAATRAAAPLLERHGPQVLARFLDGLGE
jgi:GMP synthase (glutamine-hydrolysing)